MLHSADQTQQSLYSAVLKRDKQDRKVTDDTTVHSAKRQSCQITSALTEALTLTLSSTGGD